MIPSELLDEWIAYPKKITPEIGRMLAEQVKQMQRNTTFVYVFTQQFFDGTPENRITPDMLEGFTMERMINADWAVALGQSRLMMRQGESPVSNPPTATPAKVEPPPKAITVQDVINAFDFQYGDKIWTEWSRAGLGAISDRYAPFTMYELLPKEIRSILNV